MTGLILVIAIVIAVPLLFRKAGASPTVPASGSFAEIVNEYARIFSIPPAIIRAVIWKESKFNPNARNDERKKGDPSDDAVGLMQVRQPALTDFNAFYRNTFTLSDLYDPRFNVWVGSWYLSRLIKKHGLSTGVEMYNVGESGYQRGVRNADYRLDVMTQYNVYNA